MCADIRERTRDLSEELKDAPSGWSREHKQESSLPR